MNVTLTLTLAGKPCTKDQVKGTLAILGYYRRFLKSNCERCRVPSSSGGWQFGMDYTKTAARRELARLVNVAINRKAGIPDVACRKQETEYQSVLRRECREINDHFGHRRRLWGLNGRRFQNDDIQARYGHLLNEWDD